MKKTSFVIALMMLTSCRILPTKKTLKMASYSIEIGSIGELPITLDKQEYQIFGIPTYTKKIKTSVRVKDFDKKNYKRYVKYLKASHGNDVVNYVDSIKPKPQFLELKILDKVSVIHSLNARENLGVFNYLKNHNNSSIVSKVRLPLNENLFRQVKEADSFYIETLQEKEQYLVFYKEGVSFYKMNLSDLDTFEYDLSSFCWEVTSRRKIRLSSILSKGQECTYPTKNTPSKLIKELTKSSIKFTP